MKVCQADVKENEGEWLRTRPMALLTHAPLSPQHPALPRACSPHIPFHPSPKRRSMFVLTRHGVVSVYESRHVASRVVSVCMAISESIYVDGTPAEQRLDVPECSGLISEVDADELCRHDVIFRMPPSAFLSSVASILFFETIGSIHTTTSNLSHLKIVLECLS